MSENTMRAVRFHEYGPAEMLVVDTVPRPEPGEGEALVRVHASGVNPIDWKFRAGYLKDFMPLPLPYTPGIDLAGVVEAVGQGVTTLQKGQEVYGRGRGAYAEDAIAAGESRAEKPRSRSLDR